MAHHGRKSPRSQATKEGSSEEKVLQMGLKGMNEWMHTSEGLQHTSEQCMQACATGFSAVMESCSALTHAVGELSKETIEVAHHTAQDYTQFLRDAVACKNLHDANQLQSKLREQRIRRYLYQTEKSADFLVKNSQHVMKPLEKQIATASREIGKAITAWQEDVCCNM